MAVVSGIMTVRTAVGLAGRRRQWQDLLLLLGPSKSCFRCRSTTRGRAQGPVVRAIPARPVQPARPPAARRSPSSSASSSQPLNTLFAQRRVPLIGAALAAGVLGFYIMPLLVTYLTGGCSDHTHQDIPPDAVPSGLPPMRAAEFDASLDLPERMMGITSLRQRLAAEARGAVLEVAVGTGRNLGYYTWGDAPTGTSAGPPIASFTGIDLSADALGVARRRLRSAVPGAKAVIRKQAGPGPTDEALPLQTALVDAVGGRLRLMRADAMEALPAAKVPSASSLASSSPPELYDTIVQTFGLCSVADPVALLANMAAAVRPDSGRILLLEHGRGRWPTVNSLLDRYAGRHFARFGCWWNRDMDGILAAAQAKVPGLEVVAVERPGWFQFGTLWWIELRVNGEKSE